ncbi:MAG: pyruvate formate lyase family protein [Planctomycetaceae bacterium]|nr:hypothetical protein [Planctomycetaceae bacterium]
MTATQTAQQSQDLVQKRIELARQIAEHTVQSLAQTPPEIRPQGLIAGPMRRTCSQGMNWGADNLHYPMDVRTLLRLGVSGIAATARENATRLAPEQADYLRNIACVYEAIASFIAAHARLAQDQMTGATTAERHRLKAIAENCAALAAGPPATFAQAVQLFWFIHSMRGMYNVSSTIGRLDQHLNPFYVADVAAGRLTRDEALELTCELWRLLNIVVDHPAMGLMNLMVGGQDAAGNDATNDVSYLLIDTAIAVNDTNPFLSARIHARTPAAFIDKVVELQLVGHGQGTIYNDELIIPSLVNYGVPIELARNFANDGCNEVTIDGQSTITFTIVDALKSLELAIFNGKDCPSCRQAPKQSLRKDEQAHDFSGMAEAGLCTGDFAEMTSFDQFFDAFWTQFKHQIETRLEQQNTGWRAAMDHGISSPVMAGTFKTVLETGLDPFRGGVETPILGIFLGTLGTAGDCLAAIRKVIFEDKAATADQLRQALAADWKGFEPLRRQCLAAPKYGNDDDYVDRIIAEAARRAIDCVRHYPSATGRGNWPCLFNHSFLPTAQNCGATADGRKWMEPVGEHFSPTPGRAISGPTAVIRSATKSPLHEAVGVAIFHVGLSRDMAPRNSAGAALVKSLLQAGLKMGATTMNTAIYDIETLKAAKAHPEKYADLIVRVWGYSARFTGLSEEMQDHIIARAVRDKN